MKTTWVAALVSATMVLASCGGGDELSKDELVKEANAICAKYSKKGEGLGAPNLQDPEKASAYFGKARTLIADQQKELEALKPAESVKADYDKLTDASGEVTGLLGDLESAAKDKDQKKGAELLQRFQDVSTRVNTAAQSVGADSCASGA